MSQKNLKITIQNNHDASNQQEVEINLQILDPAQKEEENQQQKEMYICTDNEVSQDEGQLDLKQREEKLALKNKNYIAVLKKASNLFHENQSKQYIIERKKEQLKEYQSKLQHIRNEKKNRIARKTALAVKKAQLQRILESQTMRIGDLNDIIDLLKQLNSMPITSIPSEIAAFQKYVTQEFTRLGQNNNAQKIHCILEHQNILLDNMSSIAQQLNKE